MGDAESAASSYRYGFNGKENDNEVKGEGNQQDYGMRVYDPRLGRFLSVDPLTGNYPWYTPYQFAGNTPVQAADLDGLEEFMKQLELYYKRQAEMRMAHAEQVGRQQEAAKAQALQKAQAKPIEVLRPTKKLETTIRRQEQKVLTEAMFVNAGYNPDGSLTPLQKLGRNDTFQKLDENIATPMAEMALGDGLIKIASPLIKRPLTKVGEYVFKDAIARPVATTTAEFMEIATDKGFKTLSELGLKDGMKVSSSKALELGGQFLGKGYRELVPGSGRYVSADGTRVFGMGISDITGAHGGGPHVNFETLVPNPAKAGRMKVDQNIHVYIEN